MAHDELVLCDEGDFRLPRETADDELVADTAPLAHASLAATTSADMPPATRVAVTLLPPPPTRRSRVVIPPHVPVPIIHQYAQLSWLWVEQERSARSAPRPARDESSTERSSSMTTKKRSTRKRTEPRIKVA